MSGNLSEICETLVIFVRVGVQKRSKKKISGSYVASKYCKNTTKFFIFNISLCSHNFQT